MSASPPRLVRASLEMMRPYRRQLVLALIVLVGALSCTLAGPALVSYAINHGLVRHHDYRVIEVAGIAYLAVALAFFGFTRTQTRLLSGVGELILNDLRKRVFAHLLSQPLAFFDSESSAQLLSRMTADIDVLESLVQSGIGSFVTSVGLFVTSLAVLLVMSPLLFGVTCCCLVPVVIAAARYRITSSRAYTSVRHRIGDTLSTLDEGLAGVRVVQAFRQERRLADQFAERNDAQRDADLHTVALGCRFFPKVEGTGVVTTAVLLLVGGSFIHLGLASVGTVAAFALYMANLFNSIQSLSQLFDLLQSSGAALGTVFSLLAVDPTMVDPADPEPLPRRGTVELRDVSFAYPSTPAGAAAMASGAGPVGDLHERPPVLSGVDLQIPPGEHLVLVGPTGAGKSTLAKLIGRLYDPAAGSVRFGGVDLRRARLAELRRRVVVVPQEGFLFRGSVLDNVLVGRPDASAEEVLEALERLGVARHLTSLPEGLDTDVGERGARLSAGERQLVSLARAALADPAVLVLDEATSSLDPGTEAVVERAVASLSRGRTTVTVAHRLSTAERADRVGVVRDGKLVEIGSHRSLVAAGGAYAELFRAWSAGVGTAAPGMTA
ncbi:MAG: hypothetical protein JWM85_2846 [Acidimicrobiaceae bacterium]|nr:hypothetical protein [Acidimicrobiaceae bacterium]